MALHAPNWPLVRQDSMTAASSDLGIIQPANEQRQPSNSNDYEWARFLASLNHHDQDPSPSNGIDFGNLDLNDSNIPTHFGSMDINNNNSLMLHTDPLLPSSSSAATSSSALPVLNDSNTAPQQYMNWQPLSLDYTQYQPASTPWIPSQQQQQHQFHQQDPNTHFMQSRDGLGIQMPPTSHPIYTPSALHYDQPFLSQESSMDYGGGDDYPRNMGGMWDGQEQSLPPQDDLFADDNDEAEPEDSADPCYAQLLHRCLKEAPGHTMSLRDLYEWVSQHSQKAKDLKNRGWQNSVRHNLSMNAAFQRVPHSPTSGPKKGSLWRLTDDALKMGVISTTRYRKDPKRKSDRRSTTPAPNRQASGARGGRATRDATRLRQRHNNNNSPTALNRFRRSERSHTTSSHFSPYSASPSPGMPPTGSSSNASQHAPSPYFLDLDNDEVGSHFPLPIMSTPPSQQGMMMYDEDVKPPFPQQNLDYLPMEYGQGGGFFATNGHEEGMVHHQHHHHQQRQQLVTPTASQGSYMTDTSYLTDGDVPGLMMSGGRPHDDGREAMGFQ